MNKVAGVILFIVILTLLLSGCGEKPSEKVVGVWLGEERSGKKIFIEIGKEKLIFDDDEALDIVLEDKDNKIAVRMAGINDIIAVITVIDKNNIEFTLLLGFSEKNKIKLKRSSKEEQDIFYHPPVEKIAGYWKDSTGKYATLEIAPNYINIDGNITLGKYTTKKGVYNFIDQKNNQLATLYLNNDKNLVYKSKNAWTATIYNLSNKEDIEKIYKGKQDKIEETFGFWLYKDLNFVDKSKFLEISENMINDNGNKIVATFIFNPYEKKVMAYKDDKILMSFNLIEKNVLRVITPTMFIGDIDYLKSSQAELEKISNSKVKKESDY